MHRSTAARAGAPLALVSLALAFAPVANAQIRTPGTPAAMREPLPPVLARYTLPPVDVAAYLAEDELRGHRPLRYGAMVPAGQDINRDGQWEVLSDGTLVGRLVLLAPGAYSIGLEFVAFDLPEGAQMYLYDDTKTNVFGAYTSENERPDRGFVIEPFPGDHVILEVVLPPDVTERPDVVLGDAIHDYRDVAKIDVSTPVGGGGGGSGCLIDVNCPEGDPWPLQKRATVRTLSGGGLCSAALINNTSNNGTRYILTADHCGQSNNTVFTFNYQTATCGTGSGSQSQTVSGATLLATNPTYDNRLMQITSTIPTAYAPYYAGWSRSTTNATSAFAMGHPSGGPKKISIDANGTFRETNLWRVTWSAGTLEGGSSGGPLFDQNGRIRGPACCVDAFDCSQTAWFGRFDKFWTADNIGQWLDPLGTNPTTLNGFDPSAPPPGSPPTLTSIVPNLLSAMYVDNWPVLTLNGNNLSGVTGVKVNDVPLSQFVYPKYTKISNTQITIDWFPQLELGSQEVEVANANGTATLFTLVFGNGASILDLAPSDPGIYIQSVGMDLYLAGPTTNLLYLLASTSDLPSVLPGIVSFDLGNNFTNFVDFSWRSIDPVSGWTKLHFQNTTLSPGTRVHFQAFIFPTTAPAFPFAVTNRQSITVFL
jgi:hypothetical protein